MNQEQRISTLDQQQGTSIDWVNRHQLAESERKLAESERKLAESERVLQQLPAVLERIEDVIETIIDALVIDVIEVEQAGTPRERETTIREHSIIKATIKATIKAAFRLAFLKLYGVDAPHNKSRR